MELVLESGVPIPPRADRRRGPLCTLLAGMQVGDSFLVDETNGARPMAYTTAKRVGVKVTIRATDGGKLRIWRIA